MQMDEDSKLTRMQLWTAEYRFSWTPIMAFEKRRLSLLDWMQENIDPLAFTDKPTHIGVSVLHPDIRLVVDRDGVAISQTMRSGSCFEALEPALAGVLEVLKPKSLVLAYAGSAWSSVLDIRDYETARRQFAERASGIAKPVEGLRAKDASILMDFYSDEHHVQAEWGVVEPDELRDRIAGSIQGRTAGGALPQLFLGKSRQLAAVSLFADIRLFVENRVILSNIDDMRTGIERLTATQSAVAEALFEASTEKEKWSS